MAKLPETTPKSLPQSLPAHWLGQDILLPFVFTRFMLLWTGYFARYFPVWPFYPQAPHPEGWLFSPHRWLDIWGRWDTYWYLDIVQNGYQLRGALTEVQSNVAFFPLYPALVKLVSGLIPGGGETQAVIFVVGVLLSNLFAIAALILLYRITFVLTADGEVAAQSVQYLLLFPTGFFLSCFYTESLFLCLSLLAFWFALNQRWNYAAIAGVGAVLTRPQGVFIVIPLAWQYLETQQWQVKRIGKNSLWLLLPPAGLLLFLLALYPITGSLSAPFEIQVTWGKILTSPWHTLFTPIDQNLFTTPVDQWILIGALVLAGLALFRLPSRSYGVYALLMLVPSLFTGILRSSSRYCLVVFPIFILLGMLTQRYPTLARWLPGFLLTLQVLLMVAWCQLYWVA